MSKTAATPREKSKLATKAVTPQAGNMSLATDTTTNDEDDGPFVDVDSGQTKFFNRTNMAVPIAIVITCIHIFRIA